MPPPPGPPDVLVVGAPRSGTSLVGQLLADAGFHFGRHLLAATDANPRGFYEDVEVTELGDELLLPHLPPGHGPAEAPARLAWLAVLGDEVSVSATPAQRARFAALLPERPACIKDPRFPYVLDAWRPALRPGTRFVAVVRAPGEVATSLRAMWQRDPGYYAGFEVTLDHGFALWEAVNRRLLRLCADGRWLVVDHADLVTGRALPALGRFVGLPIPEGAIDVDLHRSAPAPGTPDRAAALYAALAALAREAVA
ncbi:sulfotransferase [Aquihabitans sp. G128]|uniref:sulfotransferase n=1 Tax=Aquihabitans sp. G128 TaxID=2849779 RepID=UPI001C24C376|nr:sulfotransferase [Aquihabitans sp. G128]QXC60847.1 sulfotransferase [Aquihabitans sp. G128]